jgi:hypothetical protein
MSGAIPDKIDVPTFDRSDKLRNLMRWEPITAENVVAKLSGASEHAICDFKVCYDFQNDPTKRFEIAKDVCAFANHLGGTIIVGAKEGRGDRLGLIDNFLPLTSPTPTELVKEVDRVIRNLCLPVPVADAVSIELDANQLNEILRREASATTIVAINVEPTLSGPIGCLACVEHSKVCKEAGTVCKCTGMKVPDARRFPIRAVEGADLLRPDQIARRMNVNERRALLDLQPIEDEKQILVWFNSGTSHQRQAIPCRISKLDPEIMICVFQGVHIPDAPKAEVPLVFIRAIWPSSVGWNVAIDGSAFDGAGNDRQGFALSVARIDS